jgi:hypothetical protein
MLNLFLMLGLLCECIPLNMQIIEEYIFLSVIIQVDIPIKYLSFFLEDDAELEHTKKVSFLSLIDLITTLVNLFCGCFIQQAACF